MAGFLAVGLEIGDGGAVCCQHAQAGTGFHLPQFPVGPEYGQRAVQAFDVQQGLAHGR